MNAFTLLFINLSCLGCLTFAEKDTESGKTPPKEEWLDPGNMIKDDAEKGISATLASAISYPFEVLSEATGKGFRALSGEVPIQWQPVIIVVNIIIFLFMLSRLEVKLPFMTIRTVPAIPGNLLANLQLLQNQVQNIEAAVQQLNNAVVDRDGIERIRLEDEIRHEQRQIMELLNTIHQAVRRQEQRAIGVVGGGADNAGAEEERPERAPVPESPKLKVPVQNSDQGIKFMSEQ